MNRGRERKKETDIRWLFAQVGDRKGTLVLSILAALVSVLCGLVPYFAVARLVRMLIGGEKDLAAVGITALVMLVFYALKVLFHCISTACSHGATFEILANIRKQCMDKLARMPLGDVLVHPAGELKSIMVERLDSMETTLAHIVPEYITNLAVPLVILAAIFFTSPVMGIAAVLTLPLGMLFFMGMMAGYDKNYARVLRATKNLNDTAVEYISGIEVIKVFGKTRSSYQKFADAAREGALSYIDWMRKCNLFFSLAIAVMPATMLTVLPVGAWQVRNGSLKLEDLIIVIIYAVALAQPLITVMSYNDDIKQAEAYIAEIRAITDAPEMERPKTAPGVLPLQEHGVELKNVHFAYREKEVLHGISMKIPDKAYVSIVSPSGSGKSTAARLIAGLWDVQEGEILMGGIDSRQIPMDNWDDSIAYVSQNNYLFNETIRENIRMGMTKRRATDEEVEEVAKKCGCHDFIMGLENGYDTAVGSGGGHLSGGEQQRICIARAMLKDAPVIILDEATAYTDPENEALIQESVSRLVADRTLIVIAHRLSAIQNADRIFVMDGGNIAEQGTHQELLQKNGLYKRMWEAHISARDRGGGSR